MYLLLLLPVLLRLSGSSVITGPEAVHGWKRGSLMVQCHYDPGWENYVKWWCRGAKWSSCKILVKTIVAGWGVWKDRVSIKDNRISRIITVTMEKLEQDDADTYWCGIERAGRDHGVQVKVIIGPATTAVSSTTPTTSTAISTINTFTASVTPGRATGFLTATSHSSDISVPSGDSMPLSHLLPIILAVLLLLLVAAALVVWRVVNLQRKAAGDSPEQVSRPLENELCYANLTLTQTGRSPHSSRKKASLKSSFAHEAQVEAEYITMDHSPKEDISYAALSLDTSDQEPTYSNMGGLVTHLPGRSPGEPTEYSTIREP